MYIQCRNKWNALKSGYENLKKLLDENPEDLPTYTPTLHDEHFHDEFSALVTILVFDLFIIYENKFFSISIKSLLKFKNHETLKKT